LRRFCQPAGDGGALGRTKWLRHATMAVVLLGLSRKRLVTEMFWLPVWTAFFCLRPQTIKMSQYALMVVQLLQGALRARP